MATDRGSLQKDIYLPGTSHRCHVSWRKGSLWPTLPRNPPEKWSLLDETGLQEPPVRFHARKREGNVEPKQGPPPKHRVSSCEFFGVYSGYHNFQSMGMRTDLIIFGFYTKSVRYRGIWRTRQRVCETMRWARLKSNPLGYGHRFWSFPFMATHFGVAVDPVLVHPSLFVSVFPPKVMIPHYTQGHPLAIYTALMNTVDGRNPAPL